MGGRHPEATSIVWPKVPLHSQTWVLPRLQLNRGRSSQGDLGGGSASCTRLLHVEVSEHKLFTVFTSTVPQQTKANTTSDPSPGGSQRGCECVCVCMRKMGVRACEHTDVLRGSPAFSQRHHQSVRCRLKTKRNSAPRGPGRFLLCSVSFSSRHPRADMEEPSQLHPGPRQFA